MIGSIGSGTARMDAQHGTAAAAVPDDEKTVADHVAADDDREPTRSAHPTLGTIVDTYL